MLDGTSQQPSQGLTSTASTWRGAGRPGHRPGVDATVDRAVVVVTDGGTLAAHASLVAREYGIPAVVGTGDATLRLRAGQGVTVDGGAGTVELGG